MQSSSAEQIAYKQNFVNQRLNYVSCIRITQIANRREAINELQFELESSQFKYGPLVSFRVIPTPIRDAPNDPTYHQTVIAFAQFKYTISNYYSKIMQGIPYRHTDPFPLNHDTPPPVANTQHENVAVQADLPLPTDAQAVNVVEQVDPPIVINEVATPPLEPTVNVVENQSTK